MDTFIGIVLLVGFGLFIYDRVSKSKGGNGVRGFVGGGKGDTNKKLK